MKKKAILAGLISLALAVAVAVTVVSCGTLGGAPGAPGKAKKNYLPDTAGNMLITNGSGKSVDLFVNDVYLRSIPRGGSGFRLNIAAATNPNGTDFMVKVYDEDKVGNLDAPSDEGLLNTFAAALFPSSDASRIMPIQIPEPAYRDQAPSSGAGGDKQDVLVKFSYPFENPRMGTITVVVYRGQVTSRSSVVTLRPQVEPIYVPLPADDPVQLNLLYTVAANNTITKFYWPDWENEIAYNNSIKLYTNNRTPEFEVKAVDEMTTVTWVYPQNNYGSLMVYNKSTAIQALRAAHIAANGKGEGGIGTIANGGANNINIGPVPQTYQFTPGQYVLTATGQGRNSRSVSTEINFEAGNKYIWIITDGAATLQADKTVNIATNLDKIIQNWKIRSNVPGACCVSGY